MDPLELERQVGKLVTAMTTRNLEIGRDLVADLATRLTPEGLAGVMLISLERLLRFDAVAFLWTVEHLIPETTAQEIRKLTALTVCQRLIGKGFRPGQDFSTDLNGQLLLNRKARAAVLG